MTLHAPRFEELEARLLYSADPLPGLVGFAPGIVEERHLLDNGEFAPATTMQVDAGQQRREVVFIDTSVPDWDLLLQDLRSGQTQERVVDVLLIDAQRDGFEQVTQALSGRHDVAALHFITHGESGAMQLGSRWLDLSSMHNAGDEVARWGDALTADGDILLYGCDVAQGEHGAAFLQTLARLTGADVAASNTATGAAARGGDWTLEVHSGTVESAVAVSTDAQRAWSALLQSSPQGGETLVNTTTTGSQDSNTNMPPRTVAIDASGNFVVVWHGQGTGDADGVYGQRFDANGAALGAEFRVNTTTGGLQNDPVVAMDAAGTFVVAWTSTTGDGSGEVVFAQRYDANGVAQGGEFRVNTTTLNDQGQPVVAMYANGFVIAWSDSGQDGSQHGVFAQRYDVNGVAQGGQFQVNASTLGDQWIDSAAMDSSGNFIITWSTAQDGSSLGVYSRRFDSSGTALTGEVLVNSTTIGEQSWSSVAMNGSGAYVVIWRHDNGGEHDIYAQRYNAAGVAQGAEFRVNTTAVADQWPASVAIDGNGNFVVTWSSVNQDAAGTWGVYKQEYFANGTAASSETLVNTTVAGEQDWSAIAMNSSGAYVIAWAGNGSGDADGIFFQRYVHNAPVITSNGGGATAAIGVAENTTAVTTVTASDADAGTTFSYAITGGADAARFTINPTTGALAFAATPNYEAPTDSNTDNIYDVVVQVSDGDLTDSQAIWVTVSNVNDNAPVITSLGGGATASINVPENGVVTTATTATDADAGTTLSYSIVGGADAAHFSINPTTGVLGFGAHDHEAPTDAGANNVYDVIVQVSDGSLTDTQAIAVTVTNLNDNAPVITSGGGGAIAALNVAENSTAVVTVTSTDADNPGTTPVYSIVGGADAARFTIDAGSGALSFVTAPDRESPIDAGTDNVYDVVVQVSDGSLTDTQAIAVTVTNVNDNTPVITSNGGGPAAALNVAENTTAVTTVSATDADAGASISYSIVGGADAARFTINSTSGALAFATAPDREVPTDGNADNVYDVVVQASDGVLTDTQALSVTVTNTNDNAPVITSNGGGAAASVNVAENSTAVTTVVAGDADAGTTLTYSIAGGADAARFTIDAASGVLAFAAAPDHEAPIDAGSNNVYDVTVQVSDGTLIDVQTIAVTVTGVNDNAPLITSDGGGASAARSVAENSTTVTTVTATDADAGATLSYSIAGGADAARFTIDATSGALSFSTAPDFEAPVDAGNDNVYDVIVRVSDGSFNDTQAVAVTVTDVDDSAPVITSDGGGATAARSMAENSSVVTTVTATDPDVGSTMSYSIVGGVDAARFAIDATTGVLSFIAAPDAEVPNDGGADNVYDVIVQASDGALTDTQAIALTVTNVNDNAPAISSSGGAASAALGVAENGTAVAMVTASDADAGATLAYSIVGGSDAARFTIDATTGVLGFVGAPDHEAPVDTNTDNVYHVVVQVSDGTLTDTQSIAVTVTDLHDVPPVITSNGGGASVSLNVAENLAIVTTTSSVSTGTPTYSIAGGADASIFAIDAATGVLRFVTTPDFEAPADADANNVYHVIVQVFDAGLTDTQAITVVVGNVVEQPVFEMAVGESPIAEPPGAHRNFAAASGPPTAASQFGAREQGPRAHMSAVAANDPAQQSTQRAASTTRGLTGGSNFDRVTSREARGTVAAVSAPRSSSAGGDASPGSPVERRLALDDFIAQRVDDTILKLDPSFQLLATQAGQRGSNNTATTRGHRPAAHDEEPAAAMSIDVDTVRYAGVALSAGVVWWVTRAGGLVASMLATAPAWRHLDLLPVLAANDERDDAAEAVFDAAEEQVAQDMLER